MAATGAWDRDASAPAAALKFSDDGTRVTSVLPPSAGAADTWHDVDPDDLFDEALAVSADSMRIGPGEVGYVQFKIVSDADEEEPGCALGVTSKPITSATHDAPHCCMLRAMDGQVSGATRSVNNRDEMSVGETLEVLLDLSSGGSEGTMRMSINGVDKGECFKGMAGAWYPAAAFLHVGSTVSISPLLKGPAARAAYAGADPTAAHTAASFRDNNTSGTRLRAAPAAGEAGAGSGSGAGSGTGAGSGSGGGSAAGAGAGARERPPTMARSASAPDPASPMMAAATAGDTATASSSTSGAASSAGGRPSGASAASSPAMGRSLSVPAATPSAPPVKVGWLLKRGRVWKTWRRRWFRLEGGAIVYATDREDAGGKVKGSLPSLGGGTVEAGDGPQYVTVRVPGRDLLMQAESAAEATEWATAIRAHAAYASTPTS